MPFSRLFVLHEDTEQTMPSARIEAMNYDGSERKLLGERKTRTRLE